MPNFTAMKVLFIVQGEGRGHLTQAITTERILRSQGHEVVEVLVGKSGSRQLPAFFERSIHAPVRRFDSPNFLPAPQNKRNTLPRTIAVNLLKTPVYVRSVLLLSDRIEKTGAELVVNFYEMLTGFVYLLFRPRVPQVSIGHQYLFLHDGFDFPKHCGRTSLWLLRLFTSITSIGARERLALSFRPMADDEQHRVCVIPPLLRDEVLATEPSDGDFIHGYMVNAGFGRSVEQWHREHPEWPLRFFWDKKGAAEVTRIDDTLSFHSISDTAFLQSLAACRAYATTAGFESVCEAMYFGKPMLLVPAHVEQDCNAHDAARSGAAIVAQDFDLSLLADFVPKFRPDPSFQVWARSCQQRLMARLVRAVQPREEAAFSWSSLVHAAYYRHVGQLMLSKLMRTLYPVA